MDSAAGLQARSASWFFKGAGHLLRSGVYPQKAAIALWSHAKVSYIVRFGVKLAKILRTLALFACACALRGTTVAEFGGLTVTVSPGGTYTVSVGSPDWTFAGSVGVPLSGLTTDSGNDAVGGLYNEIAFDFVTDAPRHAAIRTYYVSRSVLFTVSLPAGGPNSFSFPALTNFPAGLHTIAFAGTFGFPTFQGSDTESPWIALDRKSTRL